jgi:sorting nexin-29
MLSTSYNILSNILLSRLIPHADEIIGDHQCSFRSNRSNTAQIFSIRQILEKKWEYNGTVYQLYIDFLKAYDLVRRLALYNILIEFGIPRKLVGLIKMCLNETYSRVRTGKNLPDKFTIENGLKQGDASSPLPFNFALEYAIRRVQGNQEGLIPKGTHQVLAYTNVVNMSGESIYTIQKNTKDLLDASKKVGLEVNPEKTKYMLLSICQKAGQKQSIKEGNRFFENVAKFKHLGTTPTDQNCIHEEIKSRLNSGNACYHSVQSFVIPPAVQE